MRESTNRKACFESTSAVADIVKNNKLAAYLFIGFMAHILSFVSTLSNKEVNNIFYIGVMLPALLLTRPVHIKALFELNSVKLLVVFLLYTSVYMALTNELSKIKYFFYIFALLLAIYHLVSLRLLSPRVFAYSTCMLITFYISCQLFWYVFFDGKTLPARPWFYGWQLFVPTYMTAYLSVAVCSCLLFLSDAKKYFSLVMLPLVLLVVCLLLESRMGLLGLLAATPFFVLLGVLNGYRFISVKVIVGVVIASIIAYWLFDMGIFDSFFTRGSSYRTVIFDQVVADLKSCGLLFGCGYDYSFSVQTGTAIQITEHSSFSHHLLRSGVLGFCLMVLTLIYATALGIKSRSPWLLALFAGVGCLLVEGESLVAQPRAISQFLFWIPFFMVICSDSKLIKNYRS